MGEGEGYFDREYFELHEGKQSYLKFLVGLLEGHLEQDLGSSGSGRGRVLDIGSGYGFFLEASADAGFQPVGLERSPFAAGAARRRTRSAPAVEVVGTAESPLPFKDASFDAVTLFDVIEHVDDYHGNLRECARVTREGGCVVVITLNRFSLVRPLMGRRWSWYQDPTHIHMFSSRMLREGLIEAGFEPVRSTTVMNFCSVGETTRVLKPLRRIRRVVALPAFGDAILAVGVRRTG